jgi:hypothetical protein
MIAAVIAFGWARGPLAAEAAGAESADQALCEYCRDFTDAAVGAGTVKTSYRVGIGYADAEANPPTPSMCATNGNAACVQVAAGK